MKHPFATPRFRSATLAAALIASSLIFPSLPACAHQGQTSMGTDFWLGFMPNYIYNADNIRLFIASGTANEVWVDAYDSSQNPPEHYHQVMTAHSTWTVFAGSTDDWETHVTEEPQYRAIHVYSRNPIALYGLSSESLSADSYLALPTAGLGTNYYPSCYYDDKYPLGSPGVLAGQFLLVAPYDNTQVTIGPVTTATRAATPSLLNPDGQTVLHQQGDTWSVTLMRGQTYLVQSTGTQYGAADLTGTHVVSTKPIGLISGHQRCSIPIGELAENNGSKDMIMEMMMPVDEWGSEYLDMPTAGHAVNGDLIRVIAGEDGEQITADGEELHQMSGLIKAGYFYDFAEVTEPTIFTSAGDKPFLAVKMGYSQGYDGDPSQTDPFSSILPPLRQFQKKMVFRTLDRSFLSYATFVCQDDSISHILLNGVPITGYVSAGRSVFPGTNPLMGAYRVQISSTDTSSIIATSNTIFGCSLYGSTMDVSYGNPAGLGLATASNDSLPPTESRVYTCGNYRVELKDNDSRIADIGLIRDVGDLRWPMPSENVVLSFDSTFTPGDNVAYLDLTVLDPAKNAYAAVWTTDRAGNDTVYQYTYTAPALQPPSGTVRDLGTIIAGTDTCIAFDWSDTLTGAILTLSNARMIGTDTALFGGSPQDFPVSLLPNTIYAEDFCVSATDTVDAFDTLVVTVDGCAEFRYPLRANVVTPLILASDLNFGEVNIGDTLCKPLSIRNPGKAPLVIFASQLLADNTDFSFTELLPDTIPPGGSIVLELCFHPVAAGSLQGEIGWRTNLTALYQNSLKDTSLLTGVGGTSGVNQTIGEEPIALSIGPNPASQIATISLMGAPSANVEIFNVLGREVASFRMSGSYAWNMGALAAGTYIVRAEAGGSVLSRRIIRR